MTDREPSNHHEGTHDPAVSALYRRVGEVLPPRHLDQRVLAEAQHAVRHRRRGWVVPVSTAAVLVVGVSLVLRIAVQPAFGPHPASVPSGGLSDSAPEAQEREARPAAPLKSVPPDDTTNPAKQTAKPAVPPQEPARRLQEAPARPPVTRKKASPAPPEAGMDMFREERASAPGTVQPPPLDPEPWLTRIRELLEAGRHSEARTQMAAFRRHYPGYAVPEDLRTLQ